MTDVASGQSKVVDVVLVELEAVDSIDEENEEEERDEEDDLVDEAMVGTDELMGVDTFLGSTTSPDSATLQVLFHSFLDFIDPSP